MSPQHKQEKQGGGDCRARADLLTGNNREGGDYQNSCPGVAEEHQQLQVTWSGQGLWTVWDQGQLEDLSEKHSDRESNICRAPNHQQMDENKSVERGVKELQDEDEKSYQTGGTEDNVNISRFYFLSG